ncbi:copper resistance protein CopC [Glycomyces sp. A-F 0318]|uniref:copper resistance CopC family protein n=1 Tax=Glycomyces amatae TaxID=2881355 RepID=UPI001E5C477B|nr:copper resistance protein CopC [Glycomyces amatae]MCD0444466.1 copper resistance protein CopC [Glycomyces amatae]
MRADHHLPTRSLRRTAVRLAVAALGAMAFALAPASPAFAQAELWATSPEDGTALDAAPGEIAVTFSETLDGASSVAVAGPDGSPIELEQPEFNGNVLIQPMRYTAPGEYTVTVTAAFEDGEGLESSFAFSVASIPDMLTVAGAAPEAADGTDAEAATDAQADGSGSGTAVLIGVAVLALVVVTGGMLMIRRGAGRRHHR